MSELTDSNVIFELNNLVQDTDFLELNKLIQSKFNIFQMLGIKTNELSYSRVLAWLLNPQANHNLDDHFLRKFLKKLSKNHPKYFNDMNIEFIDIDCVQLEDIQVSVEKSIISRKRLDIFVKLNKEKEKWILVIENKLRSEESFQQTKFYSNELNINYSDYKKICVFLTPEGKKPSSEYFISFTWSGIYEILEDILENIEIIEEIEVIIKQFKNSIEVYIMDNPKLQRLCDNLYYKYGKVFEYLFEKFEHYNIGPFHNIPKDLDNSLQKQLGNEWTVKSGKNWGEIFKNSWLEIQQKNMWDSSVYFKLVSFEYRIEKRRIKIIIVSFTDDHDLRNKFRKRLIAKMEDPSWKKLSRDHLLSLENKTTWLSYNVVEDLEGVGNKEAISIVSKEMVEIIKEYSEPFDEIINELNEKD